MLLWDNRCVMHRARPFDLTRHGRDMRSGQNRVRVMKDQDVARRLFGCEIHLRAAVRMRRRQVEDASGARGAGHVRVRGRVGHNHFVERV